MKVSDLIQILNNRLREFQLSSNYARMSGDLERMTAADKEVISLQDTLYQLNLLVDASTSATVANSTVAAVIADGSTAVLADYDISLYATDPDHEQKIMDILSAMGVMDTADTVDTYIQDKYPGSPVTGGMIMSAADAYLVDVRLMMALMELDSRFGTVGVAVGTRNPGNVGNTDSGATHTYDSWQEGVTAVAQWLSRHRTGDTAPIVPQDILSEPAATSTPAMTTSTTTTVTTIATTTPAIATSTPPFATSTTTPVTASSTPATTTATTTPAIATSTPTFTISTTTPVTASTTPATTTATITPAIATSTPTFTTATTTPMTTTATTTVSTTTPVTATSTPSTTTPVTATTTPVTATSTPN